MLEPLRDGQRSCIANDMSRCLVPFRLGLFALVFVAAVAQTQTAQAAGYYGPNPDYAPSVFTYGFRGLTLGSLVGLSGGYLVARHDGFEGDDWKPLVYGVGIGALAGGGLGLTLGFVDLADDQPGMGNIALRDMVYGAGFGALVGAITGGLVVIKSGDAEHILFGAAIGTLAGTAVGLAVGLFEGRRITTSPRHRYPGKRDRTLHFALTPTRDHGGSLAWLPGVSGRF